MAIYKSLQKNKQTNKCVHCLCDKCMAEKKIRSNEIKYQKEDRRKLRREKNKSGKIQSNFRHDRSSWFLFFCLTFGIWLHLKQFSSQPVENINDGYSCNVAHVYDKKDCQFSNRKCNGCLRFVQPCEFLLIFVHPGQQLYIVCPNRLDVIS